MVGDEDEPYRVAAGRATAELKEKGSRFVAAVGPAADEAAARTLVDERRALHPDATHHCFAWRLGRPARERCSDAGEPAGTAGQPMLRVLRGAGVGDVAAVVSRWFGGTKLGKGGLARAYAGSLELALEALPVALKVPTVRLHLELPFARLGAVKALLRPPVVTLVEESYAAGRPRLTLQLERRALGEVAPRLADLGCAWSVEPGVD